MSDTNPQFLDDSRFHMSFRRWNSVWSVICLLTVLLSCYAIFKNNPVYLHDWHLIVIGLLSLVVIAINFRVTLYGPGCWPPPPLYAWSSWLGTYLAILALSLINPDYIWAFYTSFGITFALFAPPRSLVLITVIFLSMCGVSGYLFPPYSADKLTSIVGIGISFFSFTLFMVMMQRLISERYERNHLVRQLQQANADLEEAHQQLAASAAQEQELAVLRERTRLAREMHDTLGHAMVLISVKLEVIQRLRASDPQRCDRELVATKEIVREGMKELRASIANLRSPAIEKVPVCRALSHFARELGQRAAIQVTYELDPDVEHLPPEVEEVLWKVGQEAMTNIEKHAHASNLSFHMERNNGQVLMRIQDDGIGFSEALYRSYTDEQGYVKITGGENNPGHYGLSGMAERVATLGGCMRVRSAQEQGTIVEFELPLVEAPLTT